LILRRKNNAIHEDWGGKMGVARPYDREKNTD